MDNILNNLGLCNRAGYLVKGEEITLTHLRNGDLCYIFLANDSGKNTSKRILDKAKFYNVEVNLDYSSMELAQALGVARKVIGVVNKGKGFLKILRK